VSPAPPAAVTAAAAPAAGTPAPLLRSSPVNSDTDPEELLLDYCEWLKGRTTSPTRQEAIDNAFAQLQEDFYDIEGIRNADAATWERLHIPGGIGLAIQRNVKVWNQSRAKGRS
jgi:hypothetical protein